MNTTPDTAQDVSSTSSANDHGTLLDIIDSLRSQGIDRHVPLPQLIVCGDQSSGKSSVLEAVSGVRFPTKDTLCTRFATEFILRRATETNVAINIKPSQKRSDEEKKKLNGFTAPSENINQFSELIESAKEAMGVNADSKAFCEDILRVELSGPDQPHLTFVDLPGLFHSSSKQQSAEDAKLVKSLVRSYMANERSIILAVVSAKNDYANQVVTDFARQADPQGLRTLGIITKPDSLIPGSESERSFRDLAKNEDVSFRLGWHVLRNRDFDARDVSAEERDALEMEFLSQGIWTSLPSHILGMETLKPRLGTVLHEQITSVLPSLIQDVKSGVKDCQSRLDRLGDARHTLKEQRIYLIRVGQKFTLLIRSAVDGSYSPGYFGDATTVEGYEKRLRTVLQNLLMDFAEDMRKHGQQKIIVDDDTNSEDKLKGKQVTRSAFIDEVAHLMRSSRGRELPGTFNPLIVGDLFHQHSKPWTKIVENYGKKIIAATRKSLEMAAAASADAGTCEGLLRELIHPALNRYSKALEEKIDELLRPHQRGHAITYNHYFTETIQRARRSRGMKRLTQQLKTFFQH